MSSQTHSVRQYLLDLQARIVATLEAIDGKAFRTDQWERPNNGGSGITRIIEEGNLFERGGVNFSHVRGDQLPLSASAARPDLAGAAFDAMGVSLVLHPRNPYCPTVHMNVRYFVATPKAATETALAETPRRKFLAAPLGADRRNDDPYSAESTHRSIEPTAPCWWFGGGMDLTPYYPYEEDVRHFHRTCSNALAPFGPDLYPQFKAWCDRYFFIKHRNEARGVGGLFFDDLNNDCFERCFDIAAAVGDAFIDAYLPIIEQRKSTPWGQSERNFQAYRRGRYVEFNLVQDRGTLFGLQSGGRTESILMSMPPVVNWRYDWHPAPGSAEERLYTDFLPPRDWI